MRTYKSHQDYHLLSRCWAFLIPNVFPLPVFKSLLPSRALALFHTSTPTISTTTIYSCVPSMTTMSKRHGISLYVNDRFPLFLSGYLFHLRVVSRSWMQLLSISGTNDTWTFIYTVAQMRMLQLEQIEIHHTQPSGMWRENKRRVFSGAYPFRAKLCLWCLWRRSRKRKYVLNSVSNITI